MSLDVSSDWSVVDGSETITYYSRATHSTFTAPPTTVANALRRVQVKTGPNGLMLSDLVWHLWQAKVGGLVPKQGDVIQDSQGLRWVVQRVEHQTLQARWRLECLRER